jgi:hypothetical protein
VRTQRLTLLAIGATLVALTLLGGVTAMLYLAPLLTLATALVVGLYPGERTLARLRERRRPAARPRPQRVLHALVGAVVPRAGAYRRALPRRGPPPFAIAV